MKISATPCLPKGHVFHYWIRIVHEHDEGVPAALSDVSPASKTIGLIINVNLTYRKSRTESIACLRAITSGPVGQFYKILQWRDKSGEHRDAISNTS